ncbi:UNVERIFIED_CONTAM: hypothetical protein HDU68_009646 [Siphonaria sp. JEL0065]|nr:hypothetical protein HDU68_009646 [Siphonaria sp. JEL0065]
MLNQLISDDGIDEAAEMLSLKLSQSLKTGQAISAEDTDAYCDLFMVHGLIPTEAEVFLLKTLAKLTPSEKVRGALYELDPKAAKEYAEETLSSTLVTLCNLYKSAKQENSRESYRIAFNFGIKNKLGDGDQTGGGGSFVMQSSLDAFCSTFENEAPASSSDIEFLQSLQSMDDSSPLVKYYKILAAYTLASISASHSITTAVPIQACKQAANVFLTIPIKTLSTTPLAESLNPLKQTTLLHRLTQPTHGIMPKTYRLYASLACPTMIPVFCDTAPDRDVIHDTIYYRISKTHMRTCETCNKENESMKACSKCKARLYCSSTCQIRDWKEGGHKKTCRDVQELVQGDLVQIKQHTDRGDSEGGDLKELNGKVMELQSIAKESVAAAKCAQDRGLVELYLDEIGGLGKACGVKVKVKDLVRVLVKEEIPFSK